MFYLALTFGLEDDPPGAVARAVGFIEEVGATHGVEHPIQMTVATRTARVWAFRYSSERRVAVAVLQHRRRARCGSCTPSSQILRGLSDEARLIVSEPLGDLPGAWNEVPESSYGVVQDGEDELRPFKPKAPATTVAVTPA